MSIAISATIQTSRLLHRLFMGFCMMIAAGAGAIAIGIGGNFSSLSKMAIVGAAIVFIFLAYAQWRRQQRAWHLDISHQGVIRMRTISTDGAVENSPAVIYRLMPDSVILAQIMLLRLRPEKGEDVYLRILQDSVPSNTFRALSVALRWIAGRGTHDIPADSLTPQD